LGTSVVSFLVAAKQSGICREIDHLKKITAPIKFIPCPNVIGCLMLCLQDCGRSKTLSDQSR